MTDASRLTTSVIVVTKDRPEMLGNLLHSLTRQTLVPDEVVVVDNNSRQSYDAVFRAYRHRLHLRTFVETTPGIPAARNRGLREARGDILLFTDDDCEAEPRWVERMVKPFYQDPHIGLVGGDFVPLEEAPGIVNEFWMSEIAHRMRSREEAPA
jgi:glycosyltransferase involved in cell wall biosynthesis